jgi:branched-chain amino acid transport system permease protein
VSNRFRISRGTSLRVVLVLVMAVLPLYIDTSLLTIGLFTMAAVVAAIGLTILVGAAGQLSLAHAFFLAVGGYGYAYLSGSSGVAGASSAKGLGLDPLLAGVLAVLAAGFAGLLFSPIASRLRGIYLGVASLSLVFIGEFLYENLRSVSGGFNGRAAPPFSLFGFDFTDAQTLVVAGVPFGRFEKLWELFLVLVVLSYVFATNVLRGRMGRAMQTVRAPRPAPSSCPACTPGSVESWLHWLSDASPRATSTSHCPSASSPRSWSAVWDRRVAR